MADTITDPADTDCSLADFGLELHGSALRNAKRLDQDFPVGTKVRARSTRYKKSAPGPESAAIALVPVEVWREGVIGRPASVDASGRVTLRVSTVAPHKPSGCGCYCETDVERLD